MFIAWESGSQVKHATQPLPALTGAPQVSLRQGGRPASPQGACGGRPWVEVAPSPLASHSGSAADDGSPPRCFHLISLGRLNAQFSQPTIQTHSYAKVLASTLNALVEDGLTQLPHTYALKTP